jgi:membrane protein required for colicin V production
MNVLDIILLCFVALLLVNGIRKGFIISLASLVALVAGIYCAVHFSNYISDILIQHVHPSRSWLPILSFILTFLIVVILIMLLAKGLEKLIELVGMGFFNRLFGAIFGLLKGILLASILLFIINSIDQKENLIHRKAKEESIFYKPVEMIFPKLMQIFGVQIRFPDLNLKTDSKAI